jgi:formylglycine-generating enzyme required for sulfatase activity
VLGFLLLGVIIYVETDKGRIRLVVSEPVAVVKIDGEPTRKGGTTEDVAQKPGKERDSTAPPKVAAKEIAREKDATPPGSSAPEPRRDRTSAVPPGQITNSIGMELVLIPAGEYLMGSPEGDKDALDREHPQHRVRITRPFYLSATEVTRGQFRRFVDETAYRTEAERDGKGGYGWNEEKKTFEQNRRYNWQSPGLEQTDDHPVVNLSWNDAVAFCEWLSRKEGVTYRLPTEAEWEYACRAGTTTRYSFGDDEASLGEFAWFEGNSNRATHPVGQKSRNHWGLHDMYGNV